MRKLAQRLIELTVVLAMLAGLGFLFSSTFSERPSAAAKRLWDEKYAPDLPAGVSDLRPHWIQHDIGVHLFSVALPPGMTATQAFDSIERRIAGYRPFSRSGNELVLRRPNPRWDPADFDEARFLLAQDCGRLYVMYANLNSSNDRAAHNGLIRKLRSTAGSCAK